MILPEQDEPAMLAMSALVQAMHERKQAAGLEGAGRGEVASYGWMSDQGVENFIIILIIDPPCSCQVCPYRQSSGRALRSLATGERSYRMGWRMKERGVEDKYRA